MSCVLLGLADHLVTEDDPNLALVHPFDGFEAGLLGCLSVQSLDVALEFAHEEQDADDGKRPHDEDTQKESLVGSHVKKCRV